MCCWCMSDVYQICTRYSYCGVMACVCSRCSVYVHVLTLDVCMEEWVLCLHFLAINTQSNRTKTTVKVSNEAMAQLGEYSLTMWEVLGSKPSWVWVFVVVDVGAIFFYLQKLMFLKMFYAVYILLSLILHKLADLTILLVRSLSLQIWFKFLMCRK